MAGRGRSFLLPGRRLSRRILPAAIGIGRARLVPNNVGLEEEEIQQLPWHLEIAP